MIQLNFPSHAFIIERARCYLAAVPAAVSGSAGHDATFHATCVLVHGFGLTVDEARPILKEWNARCLPPWHAADLEHKLASATVTPAARPPGYLLAPRERAYLPPVWNCHASTVAPKRKEWPDPNMGGIRAIVNKGPSAATLTLFSPCPLDGEDAGHNCAAIVEALFADADAPDPLLCIGKNSREFATRPLSAWLASGRLPEFSLIVPARMTTRTGRTKTGRVSEHTLENTGPRRFVVVEFDFASTDKAGAPTIYAPLIADWLAAAPADWEERDVTRDACAALLWHLDGFAPLATVDHSGGKGLHGFFPVAGFQPKEVRRFMEYAALLGADTKLFANPSQFVRLPGGTREGGCRQSVFYDAVSSNFQDDCNDRGAIK